MIIIRTFTVCVTTLLSTVLLAGAAVAQQAGAIEGRVTDARNSAALEGAQVVVARTDFGTVVTTDGSFMIRNVPAGNYKLVARMTGRTRQSKSVTVAAGQTAIVDFELTEGVYNLDQVVITATLTENSVRELPSTIEYVAQEEIEEMGAETVADILTESQSLSMGSISGNGTVACIRGLNPKHTLVLLDGRRLSTGFRNNTDLGELPNCMIERLEIVRGPSSAIYGSDAVGGVINIITRKPEDGITGKLGVRYGQSRYSEAENQVYKGNIAGRSGKFGFTFNGTFNKKNRYDRDKYTAQTDGDDKDLGALAGNVSIDLAPGQQLLGGVEYSSVERAGIRTWGWGDGQRIADGDRRSVYAEYQNNANAKNNFMFRIYQSHFDMDIDTYALGGGQSDGSPLVKKGDTYELDQELNQVEGRWSGTLNNRNLVTAGAEYRWEDRDEMGTNHDVGNGAFFVQDELRAADNLLFIVGARLDRHSDFGSAFSPKLSATYGVNDLLRFKGSYGHGFRAPSIFELNIESSTKKSTILPNPDLEAETSDSYELGMEAGNDFFSAKVTYFRNDLQDMINTVFIRNDPVSGGSGSGGTGKTIPVYKYENTDEAMTQGVEMSFSVQLPKGFSISEEATFTDTEDKKTGEELYNRPNFQNSAKFAWHCARRGIKANFRINTYGRQAIGPDMETDSYTLLNIYLAKTITKRFEFYFGVDNISNENPNNYGHVGGPGSTGTYFYTGLNTSF